MIVYCNREDTDFFVVHSPKMLDVKTSHIGSARLQRASLQFRLDGGGVETTTEAVSEYKTLYFSPPKKKKKKANLQTSLFQRIMLSDEAMFSIATGRST